MNENSEIRFLVVDDEESIRRLCVTVAEGLGFVTTEASNGGTALSLLERDAVHIILTDLVMPQMSGIEFLNRAKQVRPRTEIAVMTGHASVDTAVQAMKLGAYDYISKPFSSNEVLRLLLLRMAEKVRLIEENEFLRERTSAEPGRYSPQTQLISSDLEEIERATIQRVFQQVNGDKAVARKMLGISRATLYRKLKRYNINPRPIGTEGRLRVSPGL